MKFRVGTPAKKGDSFHTSPLNKLKMKTLLIVIFFLLIISHETSAQQQFFLKKFPANNNITYITNSPTVKGIVFFYEVAADTSKPVFYISDFKQSDIQFFAEKAKVYNSKICFPNYQSSPGDFIYSITSEGEIIYFYHPRPAETKLN